jgi:hypothetical protein
MNEKQKTNVQTKRRSSKAVENNRRYLLEPKPRLFFDGFVPYRMGRDLLVPEKSGIYLFHDLRGVLYVGKTTNLRRRFTDHFWRQWNPLLEMAISQPFGELLFSWWLIEGVEQDEAEKNLIRWFAPPCNRVLYLKSK